MHDNALLKSESRANLKRSLLVWSAPPARPLLAHTKTKGSATDNGSMTTRCPVSGLGFHEGSVWKKPIN